jgi:hypothetical protein
LTREAVTSILKSHGRLAHLHEKSFKNDDLEEAMQMESIPLAELPNGIWRRVADHLENAREMTGGDGRAARLGASAIPIYRPDQKDAAYFEIAVPVRARRSAKGPTSGFIMVATGPHDWPISHWSLASEPPSTTLTAMAKDGRLDIERIYRVDALTYIGESRGELVAQLGEMPLRIKWPVEDSTAGRGGAFGAPSPETSDDTPDAKRPKSTGYGAPDGAGVEIAAWDSWQQLKDGYAEAYAPLIAALAREVAPAWENHRLLSDFGEGIFSGSSVRVALLEDGASFDLSGDGAAAILIKELKRPEGAPAIELVAGKTFQDHELDVELTVSYPSGRKELLRYFVVSSNTRSEARANGSAGREVGKP